MKETVQKGIERQKTPRFGFGRERLMLETFRITMSSGNN